MSTTLDRALELTRRGVAQPSRHSLAVKRALLACGIGSSSAYVAANVVGALRGGGYSSVHQTVSELTAIDTPPDPLPFPSSLPAMCSRWPLGPAWWGRPVTTDPCGSPAGCWSAWAWPI